MNIIIIGCGKIGTTLAEQLNNEGHNITLIDKNEKILRELALIWMYSVSTSTVPCLKCRRKRISRMPMY